MDGILGALRLDGPEALAAGPFTPTSPGTPVRTVLPLLAHAPSGCLVWADARLDNRDDVLARFGRIRPHAPPSAREAVMAAYLAEGGGCVDHLAGDFAFAVWDPRSATLLLARDRLGRRPLCLHHAPGRLLAFASWPHRLLEVPGVPRRINEGRIADFLVDQALAGVDATSTFFQGIERLPPAHTLTVSGQGVALRRYGSLEPQPLLRLPSDDAYAEAFLDVFLPAVETRIGGDAAVAATLSGGVDSGSVSAVAAELLAAAGRGPLLTVSGVGPDPAACPETRGVAASAANPHFRARTVCHAGMADLLPRLERGALEAWEPFDGYQTLLRALYLTARDEGARGVLDGGGGDILLWGGTRVAHLIRRGRLLRALREARGLAAFWGGALPATRQVAQGFRTAFIPEGVRRGWHRARVGRTAAGAVRASFVSRDLAERVHLEARFLRYLDTRAPSDLLATEGANAARYLASPDSAWGFETYHRVGAQVGVEPRDPFSDLRVVAFCTALPGDQLLRDGWPKFLLRRATAGRVPDAVRWRRGTEHLGGAFTEALAGWMGPRLAALLDDASPLLSPYVRMQDARAAWSAHAMGRGNVRGERLLELAALASWLDRIRRTPDPAPGATPWKEVNHG